MKKALVWVTLVTGLLLLGVAIVGHYTTVGNYASADAREWEAFDSTLASNLNNWAALSTTAQRRVENTGGDEAIMLVLYELVTERFTHKAANHTIFSNWLLAGMGAIHPAFAHIRVPETMVRRGHSLLCGQSAYVLLYLALEHGIRSRHVGLKGHVVMEAWYNDDWHLFDPDLEVVPRNAAGKILSVEQLARNSELLHEYYGDYEGTNASVVEILRSRENNTYMSYPPGAWFEWKSNVLFRFENLAKYLKFVVPLFLALLGLWMLLRVSKADPALKGPA